ncbi:cell attachment protein [Ninomys virus]|nr:cell attachment protein [Ninomys virus]
MSQLAAHNLAMSNFYGIHQVGGNGSQKEDAVQGVGIIKYASMIVGLLSLFTIIALNVTNIIYMTESGGTMQSIKNHQDSISGSVKEMSGTLIEDIKPKTDLINTMVSYNIPSQLSMLHQLIKNDVLRQCTPSFLFNNTICPLAENPTHSRYFEEVNQQSISDCGLQGGRVVVTSPSEFIEYPSFAPTATKPNSCVRLPSFSLSSTIYAYTHTIMGHGCSELDIGDHYFSIGRVSDSGGDIPNLETVSSWFINDKINRRSCTVAAGNTEAWMGCVIMTESFYDDLNSLDTGKITISYLDVFGRKREWIYTRSEILYDYTYTAVYFSIGSGMVVGNTVYFLIWGSLLAPIEPDAYCIAPGCTHYDQNSCNEAQRPPEYGNRQMVNGLLRFRTDGSGKPSINVRTLSPRQIPFGSEGRLFYSDALKKAFIYLRSTSWHSLPLTGVLSLGESLSITWTKQEAVSRPGDYPCGASNRCPKTCVTGVYTDLFPLGVKYEYTATAFLNAELYRVNPNIAVTNTTSRIYQKVVTSTVQRAGYTTTTCFVYKLRIWCVSIIELSPGTMTTYEPVPFLYHLDMACLNPQDNTTQPFSGSSGTYKMGAPPATREECYFENVDNRFYFIISIPGFIQAYTVRKLRDDRVEHVIVYVADVCAPAINAYKMQSPQNRRFAVITIGNWQFRPVDVRRGDRYDLQKPVTEGIAPDMAAPEDPGSPTYPGTGIRTLESSVCEYNYDLHNGYHLYEIVKTNEYGHNVTHYELYNKSAPLHFLNDAITLPQDNSKAETTTSPTFVVDYFHHSNEQRTDPDSSEGGSKVDTATPMPKVTKNFYFTRQDISQMSHTKSTSGQEVTKLYNKGNTGQITSSSGKIEDSNQESGQDVNIHQDQQDSHPTSQIPRDTFEVSDMSVIHHTASATLAPAIPSSPEDLFDTTTVNPPTSKHDKVVLPSTPGITRTVPNMAEETPITQNEHTTSASIISQTHASNHPAETAHQLQDPNDNNLDMQQHHQTPPPRETKPTDQSSQRNTEQPGSGTQNIQPSSTKYTSPPQHTKLYASTKQQRDQQTIHETSTGTEKHPTIATTKHDHQTTNTTNHSWANQPSSPTPTTKTTKDHTTEAQASLLEATDRSTTPLPIKINFTQEYTMSSNQGNTTQNQGPTTETGIEHIKTQEPIGINPNTHHTTEETRLSTTTNNGRQAHTNNQTIPAKDRSDNTPTPTTTSGSPMSQTHTITPDQSTPLPRGLRMLRTNKEVHPEVLSLLIQNKSYADSDDPRQTKKMRAQASDRVTFVTPDLKGTVDSDPSTHRPTLGTLCSGYVSNTVDNIWRSTLRLPNITYIGRGQLGPVPVYMCTSAAGSFFGLYSLAPSDAKTTKDLITANSKTERADIQDNNHLEQNEYKLPISKIDLMMIIQDIRNKQYTYACTSIEVCGYPLVVTQAEQSSVVYYFMHVNVGGDSMPNNGLSLRAICEGVLANYKRTGGLHDIYNPVYSFGGGIVLHPLTDDNYESWTSQGTYCSKRSTLGAWGFYGNDQEISELSTDLERGIYDPFNRKEIPTVHKTPVTEDVRNRYENPSMVRRLINYFWRK